MTQKLTLQPVHQQPRRVRNDFNLIKNRNYSKHHWVFTIYLVWSYKQDGAWVNSGRVTFAYKSHSSFAFCLSFSITNFHNHFYYISNEARAVYSDEPFSVPQECRHKLNVSIDCTQLNGHDFEKHTISPSRILLRYSKSIEIKWKMKL